MKHRNIGIMSFMLAMAFMGFVLGWLWDPFGRVASAQGGLVVVTSPADVSGSSTAVQIATSGTARWIQVIAPAANSNVVRCGDSTVTATRGLPIAAGGGFMFPTIPPDTRQAVNQHYYSLSTVYCFISSGDKASFAWGN